MKIGYIRVSSDDQNLARQEKLMQDNGIEKIFRDVKSGKNTDRQGLKDLLLYAREGDTIVIESYSRLARSTSDLLKIVHILQEKKIVLYSCKENLDTSTPQGELMLTFFAGLYQFERQCLLQRQREGIEIAKKEGKYKGRKPISMSNTAFEPVYNIWKKGEITARKAMEMLQLKPGTFYRMVKEYEQNGLEGKRSPNVQPLSKLEMSINKEIHNLDIDEY